MNRVGEGDFIYSVVEDWAKLPQGWQFGILVGVATDSQGNVYVCQQRQDPPIVVFGPNGEYRSSWGTGEINEGHTMYISPDDIMYLVDRGAHLALKLSLSGETLLEMGKRGLPSNTGITEIGGFPERAAQPFNMPTRMMPSPHGDIYVSDGYRNARVHRFAADGSLTHSWGRPGRSAAGEFHLPHSLWVDSAGVVYVCDRKNYRVQLFSPEGDYISEWPNLVSVVDICMDANETVYVHEGGDSDNSPRITTLDKNGNRLASWDTPYGHQIWVDSNGDIYMAVCWEQRIQKFIRAS